MSNLQHLCPELILTHNDKKSLQNIFATIPADGKNLCKVLRKVKEYSTIFSGKHQWQENTLHILETISCLARGHKQN